MGRSCSECGHYYEGYEYSRNQWLKGNGYSRCRYCVHGTNIQCQTCQRCFSNQNELNMHMQVHRPRNVSCPVCGDTRFKSPANAVQHVESGYCRGCRGSDNAREQIYQYASGQSGMQRYLNGTPLLTNGSSNCGGVPDYPYHCRQCDRYFRQLSQLMQHEDQKHGNRRMLGY